MKYALIGITMVVALFLIIVVVAQESKQPGMGSAIGGGAEGMMGGKSRGKDAVLSKFTVVLGIIISSRHGSAGGLQILRTAFRIPDHG